MKKIEFFREKFNFFDFGEGHHDKVPNRCYGLTNNFFRPYFAYIDACESLRIDPSIVKALFRKGKALSELCFFAKARTCYQDCLAKVQGDKATINLELEKTENKVIFLEKQEKTMAYPGL